MKHFNFLRLLLLATSALLIFSCEKQDAAYIALDTNMLTYEYSGGTQTIKVSSNEEWAVSGETVWCEVSPKTGKGNLTITVSVTKNESVGEQKTTLLFKCGKETAEVKVTQSTKDVIETNYVDMDWGKNTVTEYDENTGQISVRYQGVAPAIEENKAIILPEEYGYSIRVIKSYSISGNTINIQTEQGTLSNIFMDISFTLSTDPSQSSAQMRSGGGGRVITPSKIEVAAGNGYTTIYDRSVPLRSAAYDASFDIFSFNKDYSGEDLYKKGNHRVYWEKCIFDIGMKGVFYFDFGKEIVNSISLGELREFKFYLDGRLNIDLLLKYVFTAQVKESKENLIKMDVLPVGRFTFTIGVVPVIILVYTNLYSRYELQASAEVTTSAGCNIQTNAQIGLRYTKNGGVSQINTFTPSFELYKPEFTAKGSLSAKGSIYPRIEFAIYGGLCPWIEPMPYLRTDFEGAMRASTDGNDYLAWTSKSYAGMDVRGGFDMDPGTIFLPMIKLWKSDIYNPVDKLLLDMPKKIELVSPENGKKVSADEWVDVSFYVSSLNNITGNYFSCIGGLVNFVTNGETDKKLAVSNLNGGVTVRWKPKDRNDMLTAKIVDKDGLTISEATFTSQYEEGICDGAWVLINGVKWATRNVGSPHTFVQSSTDYGEYYQWNRGTTDFLHLNDYLNSVYAKSDSWLPSNDPSPAGYRVPTLSEIESLVNTTYVSNEWTSINGVYGGKFTDKSSGNCIFLPAAGFRYSGDGALYDNGYYGRYWSSTPHDSYGVYGLVGSGYTGWSWGGRDGGLSVRPVTD